MTLAPPTPRLPRCPAGSDGWFYPQHAAESTSLREIIHDGFLHPKETKWVVWVGGVGVGGRGRGRGGRARARAGAAADGSGASGATAAGLCDTGGRLPCSFPHSGCRPSLHRRAAGAPCLAAPAAGRWCTAWRCLTPRATSATSSASRMSSSGWLLGVRGPSVQWRQGGGRQLCTGRRAVRPAPLELPLQPAWHRCHKRHAATAACPKPQLASRRCCLQLALFCRCCYAATAKGTAACTCPPPPP